MAASMCRKLLSAGCLRPLSSFWKGVTFPNAIKPSPTAAHYQSFFPPATSPWNWNVTRFITNYRPNTRYLIYKRDKFSEKVARTVIRYDIQEAKKLTVEDVPARFYRFANGLWLRPIAGRERKVWKKYRKRRRRNKQFVFCNKTQSKMLDGMVTKEYKTRKYYPDDPLQQFQERNYCGLKQYPGVGFLRRHQRKFREPSSSTPVNDQIHESFGINRYKP